MQDEPQGYRRAPRSKQVIIRGSIGRVLPGVVLGIAIGCSAFLFADQSYWMLLPVSLCVFFLSASYVTYTARLVFDAYRVSMTLPFVNNPKLVLRWKAIHRVERHVHKGSLVKVVLVGPDAQMTIPSSLCFFPTVVQEIEAMVLAKGDAQRWQRVESFDPAARP